MKTATSVLIKACNLTVDFPTYAADRSLKRTVLKAATGGKLTRDSQSRIAVRALDSLSFEICPGDRIGLFGHNGSGKTTLLRVLTGAYAPTNGYLEVRGRVASFLDISMGMNGDATGWENIYLRGLMMGMSIENIRAKIDEIGEFSGLGEFLDMPLRTYSSGMQVRLAFSVSTAVNADILMFDEWLSVGDDDFQKKATLRLHKIISETSIMILASHSHQLLKEVCTKIFHMEGGRIISKDLPKIFG
jgi:lipopolysaccharide transport system ATP-binding protein